MIAAALKSNGFDYLQCQGGHDEGPGEQLVCFYHLWRWLSRLGHGGRSLSQAAGSEDQGLPHREGTPSLPSIYGLFRGADWQERETFDMYGIQFRDTRIPNGC